MCVCVCVKNVYISKHVQLVNILSKYNICLYVIYNVYIYTYIY